MYYLPYFGNISFYKSLCQSAEALIDTEERYYKQTLRNRMYLLGSNGPFHLSIPVVRPQGNKTYYKDILLDDRQDWRRVHWKAIQTAYNSSPYLEHYTRDLLELLNNNTECLFEFNAKIHRFISETLQLPEARFSPVPFDLRNEERKAWLSSPDFEVPHTKYTQVFCQKEEMVSNLSILDCLLNLGPMARTVII